nr:tyrosine-type recombinase/integrase [Brevundimonas naejangsanensis]
MKRKGSRSYYVRVKVPKGAREVLGKVELWRSLDTEDFAVACARAVVEGGRMRAQIEAARRNLDGTRKDAKGDPTVEQRKAEAWWMERRVPHPKRPGLYVIPEDLEPAWDATVERLAGEPVNEDDGVSAPRYDPDRERAALTLVGKVTGAVVPIGEELDRYMAQEGVKASYAARTRTATKALTDWLTTNRHADNIHAVTGRVADQFADSVAEGRTVKTLNSYISALSAYWSWLRRRHIVQENPWAGLSRREVDRSGNAEKRPFTDDEIKALLSGPANPTLRDMMLLAALTGMRQVEIGNLRVRDAEGGVFVVTKSKTTAGERSVPIHPDLAALVARRVKGKAADAYLLEELTAPASRPERRGYKISERFTDYRRGLGLDARQDGRRQSDADFHSFRRWFATKAEQAGQPPHVISAVLGHKEGRQGMTLGVYSAGPSLDQRRAVVEAVRLPKGVRAEAGTADAGSSGLRGAGQDEV